MNKKINKIIKFNSFAVMIIVQKNGKIHEVLLDLDDVSKVLTHSSSWIVMADRNNKYYVKDSKSLGIHRFIMKALKGDIVDHINHNTLDNRKCNLRVVTPTENAFNRAGATIKSKTGVRGVQKTGNRYRVIIHSKHYGYFSTLGEAKRVSETVYRELNKRGV